MAKRKIAYYSDVVRAFARKSVAALDEYRERLANPEAYTLADIVAWAAGQGVRANNSMIHRDRQDIISGQLTRATPSGRLMAGLAVELARRLGLAVYTSNGLATVVIVAPSGRAVIVGTDGRLTDLAAPGDNQAKPAGN